MGENIADLGGVFISLEGLKKYLKDNPKENKLIDNLTPIQRLFINYSIVWRSNSRPEDMKQRLLIDPHSPPIFRVNGILKNIEDYYEAFNISQIDGMYLEPEKRAKIW
jgi:putative endopeptidase